MSPSVDDLRSVELLDGERVDCLIDNAVDGNWSSGSRRALLLTNSRVILISGPAKSQQIAMASIEDVDSVEISAVGEGFSAFLWAGLAVILSVILYVTIDHEIWRVAAALAVFGMGVYLVINRLFDSGSPSVAIRAGESEIRWQFDAKRDTGDVHGFVKRLYEAKTGAGPDRNRRFALR